jgi:hypothetical protein
MAQACEWKSAMSDFDRINRRLDHLFGGGVGYGHIVIINRALPAWPGGPTVLKFCNRWGRWRTLTSIGEEGLADFLERTVPVQRADGYRLAIIGGLPVEPQ